MKYYLEFIKSIPLWVTATIVLSLVIILMTPSFSAVFPDDYKKWAPVVLTVAIVAMACQFMSLVASSHIKRRAVSKERYSAQLIHLYRPLFNLFLTRHVTSATGINAPYFKHRVQFALNELRNRSRFTRRAKRALRALFDHQISTSAEIEYGGRFPMKQIIQIVEKNSAFADEILLNLVNRADRSKYENLDDNLLTDEEFDLFNHIYRQNRRLSKYIA